MPGVGTNRYAYSLNDPVNLSDPGGNDLSNAPGDVDFDEEQATREEVARITREYEIAIGRDPDGLPFEDIGYISYGPSMISAEDAQADFDLRASGELGSGDDILIEPAMLMTGAAVGYRVGRWTFSGIRNSLNPRRVFWTGRSSTTGRSAGTVAQDLAQATGATTLEMTLEGRVLDAITTRATYPRLERFWESASRRLANRANSATVVRGSNNRGALSVWERLERPILENRNIPITVRNLQ